MLVTSNKIGERRRLVLEVGQKQRTFYMEFYMQSCDFLSMIQQTLTGSMKYLEQKAENDTYFGPSTLPTTRNDFPKTCENNRSLLFWIIISQDRKRPQSETLLVC